MKIVEKHDIKEIVKVLKEDGVIAYPTDTVYGLAVRFSSKNAKDNLINKKNRPKEKSFPIMVSDIDMMGSIACITKRDEKIIKSFMPGPLTVILNKKDNIEDWVNDSKKTLAIRMASDNYIKKIIEELKEPIFLTSANKSNEAVCTSVEEIENKELADLIVRGIPGNDKASTILDLSNEEIMILRQGPISLEDILNVINN